MIERKYGFTMEKNEQGVIIKITGSLDQSVKVGDNVVSNGRIFVPRGTPGVVKKIHPVFEGGRTTDVIEILFEGEESTYMMKFKDMEIPPLPQMQFKMSLELESK